MPDMTLTKYEGAVQLSGEYDADLQIGATIREAAESLQFMLGDWVLSMEEKHGDAVLTIAKDMSAVTGVATHTLREYARVSKTFPPARRLAEASWSHHQAAGSSSQPTTTLRQAIKEGLSLRDTRRLAKGLPLGGEDVAQKESSAPNAGTSLEESALADIEQARLHLQRALDTMSKPGFRLTVPVGQEIMAGLLATSKPFVAIEDATKAEVGALL